MLFSLFCSRINMSIRSYQVNLNIRGIVFLSRFKPISSYLTPAWAELIRFTEEKFAKKNGTCSSCSRSTIGFSVFGFFFFYKSYIGFINSNLLVAQVVDQEWDVKMPLFPLLFCLAGEDFSVDQTYVIKQPVLHGRS